MPLLPSAPRSPSLGVMRRAIHLLAALSLAAFMHVVPEMPASASTPARTVMVKDVRLGPAWAGSFSSGVIVNVRGIVFFVANDGEHVRQLWKSNGTRSGTVPIRPGVATHVDASDSLPTAVGDRLFFVVSRPS